MTDEPPLAGVTVLDLTRVAAGPFATMLMADLGAEVIKIERPGTGDEVRAFGKPLPDGDPTKSDYYVGLNRSKASVALDISRPDAADVVLRLAARSQIVIENFRPGVADHLGLGFDAVRAVSPGVVYTSITGFGSTGPWSNRPANDIMMQSVSGLMGLTGEEGGAPVRVGTSISDFSTGLFALSGTFAAFAARDRFPAGQHVEIPMLNSSLALAPNLVPSASAGVRPRRMGRRHPQIVGYGTFQGSDGAFVTVGAFSETFWRRLCSVVGHTEWIVDPQLGSNRLRLDHQDLIDAELTRVFLQRPRDEWVRILEEMDVPCSPVLELDEALNSVQAIHNHVCTELVDGEYVYNVISSPVRSAQWTDPSMYPAEGLGASTRRVLIDILRLSPEEVDELTEEKVVRKVEE